MYPEYPFSASHAVLEITRVTDRVNSLTRINNERPDRGRPTVNTSLANIEAHLQYVTTKELENARRAEVMRIVRANRPGAVSTTIARVRLAIGTMLVTYGERLQARQDAIAAKELQERHARVA